MLTKKSENKIIPLRYISHRNIPDIPDFSSKRLPIRLFAIKKICNLSESISTDIRKRLIKNSP
jgi:hypothetical protein